MRQIITTLVAGFCPAFLGGGAACRAAEWPASQRVFVERYCSDCHDAAAQERRARSRRPQPGPDRRRDVAPLGARVRSHRRRRDAAAGPRGSLTGAPNRRFSLARPVAGRRRPRAARGGLPPAESTGIREHNPRPVSCAGGSGGDAARGRQGPRLRQHRRGALGVHGTGRGLSPRRRRRDRHGARGNTSRHGSDGTRRSPTGSRPAPMPGWSFASWTKASSITCRTSRARTYATSPRRRRGRIASASGPVPIAARSRSRSKSAPATSTRATAGGTRWVISTSAGIDRDRVRGLVPRGGRVLGATVRHRQCADRPEPPVCRARPAVCRLRCGRSAGRGPPRRPARAPGRDRSANRHRGRCARDHRPASCRAPFVGR